MNRSDDLLWKVIFVLATLLTAAVPAYVSYETWSHGAPERHVQLDRLSPINPMKDLSALGPRLKLSLKVEDQEIDNLLIAQGYLHNVGKTPIVPSDYTEPLSVSVPRPWKIVAVENSTEFFCDPASLEASGRHEIRGGAGAPQPR